MIFMRTTCEVLQKALQTIKIAMNSLIYKPSYSLMGFILISCLLVSAVSMSVLFVTF